MRSGRKWAKRLKKEGSDFVIALTHLGVEADKELAKKADVDLVVGGHSHTALLKPVFIDKKLKRKSSRSNRNEDSFKLVPIVQAGSHGKYLGKLIVDLKRNNLNHVLKL